MSPHLSKRPSHSVRKSHLALVGVLAAAVLFLALRPLMGWMAATMVALPIGAAVAIHAGVGLAILGVLVAALRTRSRVHQAAPEGMGTTLHSPRLYDWMASAYTLGRETRLRARTLDVAGVAADQRVLDVGCGTGTLALAARERVGVNGTVHGVDASPEMIARAAIKAGRSGLPATFGVAAAQALPFADGSFDVVLCSLAFHHLPREARGPALTEMRRVLKPGGRAVLIEFNGEKGLWGLLNPVALIHARKNPRMLDEAEELMRRSGFHSVVAGPLGFGGMGYVLGAAPRTAR